MNSTTNTRWSIGKLLISLVAIFTAVSPYLADWNETHIYNPLWLPHAKFHNAQTMVLGAFLGLLAIYSAGEDVIAPFLENRKEFLQDVLKPLQEKEEIIYVIKNSDAERHVVKRFPHKTVKQISNGIRPRSIAVFLARMSGSFQRNQAEGLDAVYHFVFTGEETAEATVTIKNQQIKVENGLVGAANLKVIADSETWLGFLAKEKNFAWAVLTRKIRFKGSPKLFLAFGKCFPS